MNLWFQPCPKKYNLRTCPTLSQEDLGLWVCGFCYQVRLQLQGEKDSGGRKAPLRGGPGVPIFVCFWATLCNAQGLFPSCTHGLLLECSGDGVPGIEPGFNLCVRQMPFPLYYLSPLSCLPLAELPTAPTPLLLRFMVPQATCSEVSES